MLKRMPLIDYTVTFDSSFLKYTIHMKYSYLSSLAFIDDEVCFISKQHLCFKCPNSKNDFTIFKFKIDKGDHSYSSTKDPLIAAHILLTLDRINSKIVSKKFTKDKVDYLVSHRNIFKLTEKFKKKTFTIKSEQPVPKDITTKMPVVEITKNSDDKLEFKIIQKNILLGSEEYRKNKELINIENNTIIVKEESNINIIVEALEMLNKTFKSRNYYYVETEDEINYFNFVDYASLVDSYLNGTAGKRKLYDDFSMLVNELYDVRKIKEFLNSKV